jgi:hypothetical protein
MAPTGSASTIATSGDSIRRQHPATASGDSIRRQHPGGGGVLERYSITTVYDHEGATS